MTRLFSLRPIASACSALALMASCAPSPIPAGYTYHREVYKSPPAPKADDIGYDFTLDANKKAVDAWSEVGADLVNRLESSGALPSHQIAVVPPLGVDQIDNSLYFSLNQALAAHGYKLQSYSPDITAVAVTIHPLEGAEKTDNSKTLADYAQTHGFKLEDVTGVSIQLQLREGATLLQELSATYTIPNFGYDPEFNRQHEFRDNGVVGRAPFRVAPELRPKPIRPAVPVPVAPKGEDKMTGAQPGEAPAIKKDDLKAPAPKNEANKPLDLQEFNK